MKNLLTILAILFTISCSKDINQAPTINPQPKLQVCDIPFLPDTAGILSNTQYDLEVQPVDNSLPPIGLIYVEYRSTRIVSPYWNGGVPFTTKQVIFDSTTINYLPMFANVIYGRWRVRFTTDSAYMVSFTGYKDTVHIVSNMILSDGATTETNLLSYASGVAFINGLFYPTVNHGFVFANIFPNTRYKKLDIGSILVHESGHMIGLSHQSEYDANCVKINEYRYGTFMGNPFYPNRGKWYVGPSNRGCSIIQDDTLSLTTSLGKIR